MDMTCIHLPFVPVTSSNNDNVHNKIDLLNTKTDLPNSTSTHLTPNGHCEHAQPESTISPATSLTLSF